MKRHEIKTSGDKIMLLVDASTKAGLMSACLLALADALGVIPKTEDIPMPDITAERDFSVKGEDANTTLKAMLSAALASATKNREAYIDSKLTLVTDKKVEGQFIAVKSGLIEVPYTAIASLQGPEKQEAGNWHVVVTLA